MYDSMSNIRGVSQQRIFDIRRPGSEEIADSVGLIGRCVSFEKWQPLIHFGISEVASKIDPKAVDYICNAYEGQSPGEDPQMDVVISQLQQAVSFFTWLRIIPTLDAQHDEAGRGKRLGENEKGLTALQEWKDEENIRRLAFEATDRLLVMLDEGRFDWWAECPGCKYRWTNLLRNKREFDRYYVLHNHLVFMYIRPIIDEVQYSVIRPSVGAERFDRLLKEREKFNQELLEAAQRPLALLVMARAFRRLSAEILPGGATQLQMSQPVASRMKADREARESVAAELEDSGRDALRRLEAMVAELDKSETTDTFFGARHISHSRGFSF